LEWAFEEPFVDKDWYYTDSRNREKRDHDADFELDYANLPEEWEKDPEDLLDEHEE
jgi:hypothetical protein